MADEHTITTIFSADTSSFDSATQKLNNSIKGINSQFNLATASMGKWSDNTDGLQAKITQLNKTLKVQEAELNKTQKEYEELEKAGKGNTKQAEYLANKLVNQKAAIEKTKAQTKNYTDQLNQLQEAGVKTTAELKALTDQQKEQGKSADAIASKIGKGLVKGIAGLATACAGAVIGFLALGESTRETRKELGQLETGFTSSGHSADDARKTYDELFGVLGDSGKATEASLQLAKLATDEKDLSRYTDILTGVYATFGDSLPVDGLAEAMNHTAKLGSVQGQLADALEWSGINVDDFNAELATCNSEQERAQLITSTLSGLYGEASKTYKEVNKDVIEAQEAQAKLNNAIADLGAIAEPIMMAFKNGVADLLTSLTPFVQLIGAGLTEAFTGAEDGAGKFAEGLSGIVDVAIQKLTELLPTAVNTVVELIPALADTLLKSLPTLLDCLSNIVSQVLIALGEMLPQIVQSIIDTLPLVVQAITGALPMLLEAVTALVLAIVKALPDLIKNLLAQIDTILETIVNAVIDFIPQLAEASLTLFMAVVEAIPQMIAVLVSELPKIITAITSTLLSRLPDIVNGALQLFLGIVQAIPLMIPQLVAQIPQIIKAIVKGLIDGIPQLFNVGVELIKGLWEGILSVGEWLWKKVKGFFSNLTDKIKGFLGIHSPSKLFEDEIGKNLALGVGVGFNDEMGAVGNDIKKQINGLTPTIAVNPLAVNRLGGQMMTTGGNGLIDQLAELIGNGRGNSVVNNYSFDYTFKGMETTRLALHKAQLETKNLIG